MQLRWFVVVFKYPVPGRILCYYPVYGCSKFGSDRPYHLSDIHFISVRLMCCSACSCIICFVGDKGGDMSLETALALLQTAASEMEEESDKVVKKFLDNEVDVEEFLDQFLTKRKLTHERLVKAEKLSKILQRDPTLSNIPNYINSPPMNINSNYFPGIPSNPNGTPYPTNPPNSTPYPIGPPTIPYPTGPLNMPMPPAMNYFQNHYWIHLAAFVSQPQPFWRHKVVYT